MAEPTAWAALPNATLIDRILHDLKARPEVWDAARDAARDAAWDATRAAAWDATRAAAWAAARDAAWVAAWDATRAATWDAAWDAARSLVAWDDVGYILDMHPDAVRMLIETCTDHHKHAAVLLLPACVALND